MVGDGRPLKQLAGLGEDYPIHPHLVWRVTHLSFRGHVALVERR